MALSATAAAQDMAPDALLKAVTQEVIQLLRQDKEIQAGNPAKVAILVEAKILPHFDFGRMTQLAAARSWTVASPEQQKALTGEFKTLLVRTYSTALSSYRDQEISFKPLRAAPGDTEVTVRSVVIQPGTVPLALDYDMQRHPGGWKVYDLKIEGVSLVTTYRETFAVIVRERGVDGLIRSLSDKNRDSEARQGKAAPG
jgi:phospholipid transport system substrate-binding protein